MSLTIFNNNNHAVVIDELEFYANGTYHSFKNLTSFSAKKNVSLNPNK